MRQIEHVECLYYKKKHARPTKRTARCIQKINYLSYIQVQVIKQKQFNNQTRIGNKFYF